MIASFHTIAKPEDYKRMPWIVRWKDDGRKEYDEEYIKKEIIREDPRLLTITRPTPEHFAICFAARRPFVFFMFVSKLNCGLVVSVERVVKICGVLGR